MSTQEKARALMMRHHHLVKNRQNGFLIHTAAEVGLSMGSGEYWSHIQGKSFSRFRKTYVSDSGLGLDKLCQ
ncbi:MAG: hypothetical protein AB4426_26910 [Xenococcaceae cyanobacterium]